MGIHRKEVSRAQDVTDGRGGEESRFRRDARRKRAKPCVAFAIGPQRFFERPFRAPSPGDGFAPFRQLLDQVERTFRVWGKRTREKKGPPCRIPWSVDVPGCGVDDPRVVRKVNEGWVLTGSGEDRKQFDGMENLGDRKMGRAPCRFPSGDSLPPGNHRARGRYHLGGEPDPPLPGRPVHEGPTSPRGSPRG